MIKRAFGKKKYHKLGSLILCDAEGSPTQPNRAVKAKDLVSAATVCPNLLTTRSPDGPLPPTGGRRDGPVHVHLREREWESVGRARRRAPHDVLLRVVS